MKSYSQAGQDKFVLERHPEPGTFLDIGCNDPLHSNNTYALELAGWRGLLIDNDPDVLPLFELNPRTTPLLITDALKLDWPMAIFQADLHFKIDYLSLDVDGPELEILQNLVASGLSFGIITCEHDRCWRGDGNRNAQREFLLGQGYTLAVPDVRVFDEHSGPEGAEFEDWWVKC